MIKSETPVITPQQQIKSIEEVTSLIQYLDFYQVHFPQNGGGWQDILMKKIAQGDLKDPSS